MAATAATAANSMAHQIPSMAIPPMPRIRPPRMLKGLPHPNQNPPPSDAAPEISNAVWVQGKWRSRPSNAVRHKISTQNLQAAKALRHETHGLNIYAYRHIRTNQVVYSLARTLQVSLFAFSVYSLCLSGNCSTLTHIPFRRIPKS